MRISVRVFVAAIAGVAIGSAGSVWVPRIVAAHRRGDSPGLSPAEQQRRYLAAFNAEERVPGWAPSAEAAIGQALDSASKNEASARLERVECRAHSCVAELQWKDRSAAQQEFSRLLGMSSPSLSGCTSQIYLPPAERSPYRASLVLTACH
jgi:hypothetical protein